MPIRRFAHPLAWILLLSVLPVFILPTHGAAGKPIPPIPARIPVDGKDLLLTYGPFLWRQIRERIETWTPPPVPSTDLGKGLGMLLMVAIWACLFPPASAEPEDTPSPLPTFRDLYQPVSSLELPPELLPGPDGL